MLNANDVSYGGSSKKKEDAPALDAGGYPARLTSVIGLGLHPQQPYQGEEKPPAQQFRLTYQLDDEFMPNEDGTENEEAPRWISEELPFYNLESDRAKSTARYNSFDPDHVHKGSWPELLGAPVVVTLSKSPGKGKNEGRIFNNVTGTGIANKKVVGRMTEMVNPEKMVAFDASSTDVEAFKKFPDWLQERITSALDFAGTPLDGAINGTEGNEPTEDTPSDKGDDAPW